MRIQQAGRVPQAQGHLPPAAALHCLHQPATHVRAPDIRFSHRYVCIYIYICAYSRGAHLRPSKICLLLLLRTGLSHTCTARSEMNGWQEQGTGHLVGGAGSRTTSLRSAAVSFRHVAGCTDLFAANANTVAGRTTNLRTRNGEYYTRIKYRWGKRSKEGLIQ